MKMQLSKPCKDELKHSKSTLIWSISSRSQYIKIEHSNIEQDMEKEKLHTVSSAAPFIPSNWLSAVPSAAGAVSGTLDFSLAIPESRKPQPQWNTLQHPKLLKPKSPLNYNLERQSGKEKKGRKPYLEQKEDLIPYSLQPKP